MITEQDLQEAIAECEGQRNPTSSTCMKLAAFYTIRDKLYPEKGIVAGDDIPVPQYSRSSGPAASGTVEDTSSTEFGRAIMDMRTEDLIPIMDELMSTLQIVSPRLYAGVMRRLTE